MSKILVGVLRGGPSSEYDVSLQTGQTIIRNLPEQYESRDILIDKDGVWHSAGLPQNPANALRHVDVVWNGLHGEYGEDGQVQNVLEHLRIPYTGSESFASALTMNKVLTKNTLSDYGLKMPRHIVLNRDTEDMDTVIFETFRTFPQPSVVKPIALGSSVGVTIAKDFQSFANAIRAAFEKSQKIIVEEFISGREATAGIVDNFRDQKFYQLPPIEIVPPKKNGFYDYHAKYISDDTGYVCPGNFSDEEKNEIKKMAEIAHKKLGLRHYSRSDFIVNPRRGIYFLETNTLPGMTTHSLIPKSLAAVGCPLPEFLDHIIKLALADR